MAIVEDLALRRLPGFGLGEHHDAALATSPIQMAAAVRGGDVAGVIFHSDKGSEYTGDLFRQACGRLDITQSMGRVGSCFDDAASKSWNSTLEFELLSRRHFATKVDARREVAAFIDRYNRTRRHSSCEMTSPVDYEVLLADREANRAAKAEAACNRPPGSLLWTANQSAGPTAPANLMLSTNYPEASTLGEEAPGAVSDLLGLALREC